MVESERTAVKTIRLTKSLEKSLEREARIRRMSLNSFVASILTEYDEWDRLAEKFGMMSIPAEELIAILGALNENQVEKLAKQCGASIPRAVMEFWFSKVTPEAFLKYLALRSGYQRFVSHEVVTGSDGQFILTARHERGKKWSIWSCNYLVEAIRANFGVDPAFEINGNTYRIESPRFLKQEAT